MDIFRITVFKLKVYYFFLIYSDFKRDRSTLIEVNGIDERQNRFEGEVAGCLYQIEPY